MESDDISGSERLKGDEGGEFDGERDGFEEEWRDDGNGDEALDEDGVDWSEFDAEISPDDERRRFDANDERRDAGFGVTSAPGLTARCSNSLEGDMSMTLDFRFGYERWFRHDVTQWV